jgi:large subunit ribosomal protein L18e
MSTENQYVKNVLAQMSAKDSKLASRIVYDLHKTTRQRREVNLSRINRFTKENEFIVVPGKVLGGGEIDHKITISALTFSESAVEKLHKSGSTIITLEQLSKMDLEGKKVRIMG